MPTTFTLSIVAPDRAVAEEQVTSVIAPGLGGYFGVMRGHVPYVAALRPGLVEYEVADGNRHFVAISGGFAEISGDRMSVLADAAERATDIDVARAERALEEARKALTGTAESGKTTEEAVQEMERAMNRLRVAKSQVR
jgi:F-type H+-transporting ATPase subunit epsilon